MTKSPPSALATIGISGAPDRSTSSLSAKRKRKEKLSIYLIKEGLGEIEKILKTDDTKSPVSLEISDGTATLYVKREMPSARPPWTQIFTSHQTLPDSLFGHSKSVGAVLVMINHGRHFVLTFGTGHHLLREDSIVRDFGLRVTLNSVDPDKLRSLDKSSYDNNPLSSRTQSAREVDIFQLHMDSELDLLYAVTGSAKVELAELFGSHVTGRDALTLATYAAMGGIPAILLEALKRYEMTLPEQFDFVDNVYKVKDIDEIAILELMLDDELAKPSSLNQFTLGEPEIVDWENQLGYSFDLRAKTARHMVLTLKDLAEYIAKHELKLTAETLKSLHVCVNNNEYKSIKTWIAYRCLYADLSIGDQQYILKNGTWYKVSNEFVAVIDKYLEDLEAYDYPLPVFSQATEGEYNLNAAKADNTLFVMDVKNTKIGGPFDKVEFCDLTKGETDLIHVKFYTASATLSHLFAQGYVAAYTFVSDANFRILLNPKLPATVKLSNPSLQPDARKYRIIYAIATIKDIPAKLPFFSKVSLKQAFKSLRALGFKVMLAKIDVDPLLLASKKYKPHMPRAKKTTKP